MNKDLCQKIHICADCGRPTKCKTYLWACPWINDDEDQMCPYCRNVRMKEMEKTHGHNHPEPR